MTCVCRTTENEVCNTWDNGNRCVRAGYHKTVDTLSPSLTVSTSGRRSLSETGFESSTSRSLRPLPLSLDHCTSFRCQKTNNNNYKPTRTAQVITCTAEICVDRFSSTTFHFCGGYLLGCTFAL